VPLRIGALVGQEHMWARRSSVAVRELAELPCVMFQREQCPAMYDAIMAASERAGAFPRIAEYLNDTAATEIMVAARPYIAFASFVTLDEPRPMGLRVVPLVDPAPVVELQVAWRDDTTNVAVQAFLESLEMTRQQVMSAVEAAQTGEAVVV
jgi:DNA-binding transcriptional LysR family regulator